MLYGNTVDTSHSLSSNPWTTIQNQFGKLNVKIQDEAKRDQEKSILALKAEQLSSEKKEDSSKPPLDPAKFTLYTNEGEKKIKRDAPKYHYCLTTTVRKEFVLSHHLLEKINTVSYNQLMKQINLDVPQNIMRQWSENLLFQQINKGCFSLQNFWNFVKSHSKELFAHKFDAFYHTWMEHYNALCEFAKKEGESRNIYLTPEDVFWTLLRSKFPNDPNFEEFRNATIIMIASITDKNKKHANAQILKNFWENPAFKRFRGAYGACRKEHSLNYFHQFSKAKIKIINLVTEQDRLFWARVNPAIKKELKQLKKTYYVNAVSICQETTNKVIVQYGRHTSQRFPLLFKTLKIWHHGFKIVSPIIINKKVSETAIKNIIVSKMSLACDKDATDKSFRYRRLQGGHHNKDEIAMCTKGAERNAQVMRYIFEETFVNQYISPYQNAHTIPGPGLFAWEGQYLDDLCVSLTEDTFENLHNDNFQLIATQLKHDLDVLAESISDPMEFAHKALNLVNFLALTVASQTFHAPAFLNKIDQYTENQLEGRGYKFLIMDALLKLMDVKQTTNSEREVINALAVYIKNAKSTVEKQILKLLNERPRSLITVFELNLLFKTYEAILRIPLNLESPDIINKMNGLLNQ